MNVPCKAGIKDTAYADLFQPIMRKVIEVYQPEIIVYQSGADSLTGDRLGLFNLSTLVSSWLTGRMLQMHEHCRQAGCMFAAC